MIMDKDFDFEDIGKYTPYRVPDGFFEDIQRKVMRRIDNARRRKRRLKVMISATAMAAMLCGLLFVPSMFRGEAPLPTYAKVLASDPTEAMDKWIKSLSDEELEELVGFSENDIFLKIIYF